MGPLIKNLQSFFGHPNFPKRVERKSCKYLEFFGLAGWQYINFGTLILTISESCTEFCTCVLGQLKENELDSKIIQYISYIMYYDGWESNRTIVQR